MFKLNNKSKKIMRALSLGIVSLGLLAGVGMASNNSTNAHADADDEAMDQDIAEQEQSDKNYDANSERSAIQDTLALKNDKFYPEDVVGTLNSYPDLEHSAAMNKMISYLSPQGKEQFNEYYFNSSSTGGGLNLKESPDAAAGLNYDPKNSADNYLPLAGQHYISTAKEKAMQNPPLFTSSDDNKSSKQASIVKPKKSHKAMIAHHHARRHDKNLARNKRAKRASRRTRKAKKHSYKKAKLARKSAKVVKTSAHHNWRHVRPSKNHLSKLNKNHRKNVKRAHKSKRLTKKQVNHFNNLIRKDKKALKSKKAKKNYKYRKALVKNIKLIKKFLIQKK